MQNYSEIQFTMQISCKKPGAVTAILLYMIMIIIIIPEEICCRSDSSKRWKANTDVKNSKGVKLCSLLH